MRIHREDRVDEVVHDLRLCVPLNLAHALRRLEVAEERLVSALGGEVVGDDEHLPPAHAELARERLAGVGEGAVLRRHPPRAEGELRSRGGRDDGGRGRRVAARAVDEAEPAVGAEQEPDADVAAGLAPVLVVDRVDLPVPVGRPAGGRDRGDEHVPRRRRVGDGRVRSTVVVLHLLDREEIGRAQVVDDVVGVTGEDRGAVGGVEVLDVVGRDRDLLVPRGPGRLALEAAVDARQRIRDVQLEVGEAVVEDSDGRAREVVADVDDRRRQDRVVEEDPLGIEVGRPDHDAAPARPDPGVRAVVADDGDLAEGVRRADRDRVVHLHPHPLERLVEVDPVARGVEDAARLDVARRVVLDHGVGRDAAAGADHGRGG